MLVQEYLKENSLESLEEKFGIVINKYDDRVVLNYHMIDSHHCRFDPMVMECRGLILSLPDYRVLCRSFDRFWNYGEDPDTDEFDITRAEVTEKLDGSLINVYHDGDKWCAATRRMAFAEGETHLNKKTFSELVSEAIKEGLDVVFNCALKAKEHYTYIFELVSPESRVVKPYTETEIYLLAVRDRESGEYDWKEYNRLDYAFKYPRKYYFNSFDEALKSMNDLHALDEGYVCRIADPKLRMDWRLKVKNPSYLAVAHLRGENALSPKRIILLILGNDHEEYLSYFPEDRKFFLPFELAYHRMLGYVEGLWLSTKDIKDQREFAFKVKDTPVGSILFRLRKGQELNDIIQNMTLNSKVNMVTSFKEDG